MGQFAGCIEGMAEACRALDFPVVSGNVSFYNETGGMGILPTPSIGGLGLIADLERMCTPALKAPDEALLLVGMTAAIFGRSLYQREIEGRERGRRPPRLGAGRPPRDFVSARSSWSVSACHDSPMGGLLVALAEMALAALDAGRTIGARIAVPVGVPSVAGWLFGEDQARYLVSTPRHHAEALAREAEGAGVPVATIGSTGGAALTVEGASAISIAALRRIHEEWLPAYMAGEGEHER